MSRPHNHCLPPSHSQPGQRRFVAHVLSQTDSIAHSTFVVGIGQITTAPQRWTQASVMNGNHGFKACNGVYTEVQRLKLSALHESKHHQALERLWGYWPV